jgi:hypothetical protein
VKLGEVLSAAPSSSPAAAALLRLPEHTPHWKSTVAINRTTITPANPSRIINLPLPSVVVDEAEDAAALSLAAPTVSPGPEELEDEPVSGVDARLGTADAPALPPEALVPPADPDPLFPFDD